MNSEGTERFPIDDSLFDDDLFDGDLFNDFNQNFPLNPEEDNSNDFIDERPIGPSLPLSIRNMHPQNLRMFPRQQYHICFGEDTNSINRINQEIQVFKNRGMRFLLNLTNSTIFMAGMTTIFEGFYYGESLDNVPTWTLMHRRPFSYNVCLGKMEYLYMNLGLSNEDMVVYDTYCYVEEGNQPPGFNTVYPAPGGRRNEAAMVFENGLSNGKRILQLVCGYVDICNSILTEIRPQAYRRARNEIDDLSRAISRIQKISLIMSVHDIKESFDKLWFDYPRPSFSYSPFVQLTYQLQFFLY